MKLVIYGAQYEVLKPETMSMGEVQAYKTKSSISICYMHIQCRAMVYTLIRTMVLFYGRSRTERAENQTQEQRVRKETTRSRRHSAKRTQNERKLRVRTVVRHKSERNCA